MVPAFAAVANTERLRRWSRRVRDVALAPKPPLRSTPNELLYEIGNTDELSAFMDTFWRRSPLRMYGTMHSELDFKHVGFSSH